MIAPSKALAKLDLEKAMARPTKMSSLKMGGSRSPVHFSGNGQYDIMFPLKKSVHSNTPFSKLSKTQKLTSEDLRKSV